MHFARVESVCQPSQAGGIAHHCLMLIVSVIDRVQRFIAIFDSMSIQSLGRDQCQKPMMLFAGNRGGQCPPCVRDWHEDHRGFDCFTSPTPNHTRISLDRGGSPDKLIQQPPWQNWRHCPVGRKTFTFIEAERFTFRTFSRSCFVSLF
jgi:hypothetical protein